jgi:hypothetical protein
MEKDCKIRYKDYVEGDCEILKRCDCVFMLPNWKNSRGSCLEKEAVESEKIYVVYTM